jgi:hypothetical protein
MPEQSTPDQSALDNLRNTPLDISEMPVQGLAAYWLSLKKLLDAKKKEQVILDEASYTEEPFIKYLLEVGFSTFAESDIERLAAARSQTVLADLETKLLLMQISIGAVDSAENPRKTLIRMLSHFPSPPVGEDQAMEMAYAIMGELQNTAAGREKLLALHHKMPVDRLVVKLLFYTMWGRREGKDALRPFLPTIRSRLFAEGVKLLADNMDAAYIDRYLTRLRAAILADTQRKMDMSTHVCVAMKRKMTYEQCFTITKAYFL